MPADTALRSLQIARPQAVAEAEACATVAAGGWRARLSIRYRRDGDATRAHDLHHGPLRVLRPLYPEGPGICHHVLVHPPGGVVGGDALEVELELEPAAHALITTAGATRFYRSSGAAACQRARLVLGEGARLEWLPLETLAYSGCIAANHTTLTLAPTAQAIGWELLALGLPAAGEPFESGRFEQRIEVPGRWLERGVLSADDRLLRDSPLGLAGQPVLATMWFVAGRAWPASEHDALLDAARETVGASALAGRAGVTAPQPGVLVLRALAPGVEPAMALLKAVRAAWRRAAWGLAAHPPRVWRL
jgi:urease accessory protein